MTTFIKGETYIATEPFENPALYYTNEFGISEFPKGQLFVCFGNDTFQPIINGVAVPNPYGRGYLWLIEAKTSKLQHYTESATSKAISAISKLRGS